MNNFQDNLKPTDPKLDALLDEALAPGAMPAGLSDRIFAATSAKAARPEAMEELLDEALRPPVMPAHLPPRIFALTAKHLHVGSAARWVWRRSPGLRALAASVVLTATAGIIAMSTSIVTMAQDTVALNRNMRQLASYQPPAEAIDQELAILSTEIDLAMAGGTWNASQASNELSVLDVTLDSGDSVVF